MVVRAVIAVIAVMAVMAMRAASHAAILLSAAGPG
jgi:hypothetical protein